MRLPVRSAAPVLVLAVIGGDCGSPGGDSSDSAKKGSEDAAKTVANRTSPRPATSR